MQSIAHIGLWSTGFSSTVKGAVDGRVKMKMDKNAMYAILWNQGGRFCLARVNDSAPVMI